MLLLLNVQLLDNVMTGSNYDRSRGYFLSAGVEGLSVFDDLIFANLTRTGRCLKEITCKEVKFCVSEKRKKPETKREESGGDIFRLSLTCSQKSKPLKIEFPSRYFQ